MIRIHKALHQSLDPGTNKCRCRLWEGRWLPVLTRGDSSHVPTHLHHLMNVALGPRELGRVLHLDQHDEVEVVPHVVLRPDVLLECHIFVVKCLKCDTMSQSISKIRCWVGTFLSRPQMKQVFLMISSLLFFSVLRSANVSMMTPKMRLRTIMMTTKKKSMS